MKKYLVIIATTIIFAIIVQMVYQKESNVETEWIESCYGITCEGYMSEPIARSDWGWQSQYCTKLYNIEIINEKNETISQYLLSRPICSI